MNVAEVDPFAAFDIPEVVEEPAKVPMAPPDTSHYKFILDRLITLMNGQMTDKECGEFLDEHLEANGWNVNQVSTWTWSGYNIVSKMLADMEGKVAEIGASKKGKKGGKAKEATPEPQLSKLSNAADPRVPTVAYQNILKFAEEHGIGLDQIKVLHKAMSYRVDPMSMEVLDQLAAKLGDMVAEKILAEAQVQDPEQTLQMLMGGSLTKEIEDAPMVPYDEDVPPAGFVSKPQPPTAMVDENGEVVDFPALLLRLGWRDYPQLSEKPTAAELEEHQKKIDQVLEMINERRDKTNRWRMQCEARCKPVDSSANFWEDFIRAASIDLGRKAIRRIQSGKRAGQLFTKSIKLESGTIQFRKAGGWSIHDHDGLREDLAKFDDAKLAEYHANRRVHVDVKKFLKLVAEKPEIKNIVRGLQFVNPDEFATVKIITSKAAVPGKETDEDDDED